MVVAISTPDGWEDGLDDFLVQHRPRYETFMEVLRECVDEMVGQGIFLGSNRLSQSMAESMNSGVFLFCLAARSSWGFDAIYWRFIDKYYGHCAPIEE